MTPAQEQALREAELAKRSIHSQFKKWQKKPPKQLDAAFHEAHAQAFERNDCLTCGNCCRTTSPIIRERDLDRLSKHLRVKPGVLIDAHLRMDEDGDWVFQSAPCPFLDLEDNRCSVYDHRPQACREYPHTDRKHIAGILSLTAKNAAICPAVASIVVQLTASDEPIK
jgi:Fe-S-cluster containining protein